MNELERMIQAKMSQDNITIFLVGVDIYKLYFFNHKNYLCCNRRLALYCDDSQVGIFENENF
jgi:hypothetical protein